MPVNLPKVSIVLPTFNGSSFIHQSIESCLSQNHRNLELIIINDGSTDDTVDIINSFNDDRLQLIHLQKNQGHIAALNKGFFLCKGDYLTWTSDDNYYDPCAIERMVLELNAHNDVDFVYARYNVIDQLGVIQRQGRVELPAALDRDNYVGGCFLYRRKVYEIIGNFNPDSFLAEDYEYWLRVREKFRMKRIDEVLYFYRLHEKSLTGRFKEEKVQEQVERIRDCYIKVWKKHYFHARKFYNQQKISEARKEVLLSLKSNPLYLFSWVLLALTLLSQRGVEKIRRIKESLRG